MPRLATFLNRESSMSKFPLLSKLVALVAVIFVLSMALNAVHGLVAERQARQSEAEAGVSDSLAGPQAVLGPVLQMRCEELWTHRDGVGKDVKVVTERRELVVHGWPRALVVNAAVAIEPRYRGLFKLNSYAAKATMIADWDPLKLPQPAPEHPGATVACAAPVVAVGLSDARGIRSADIRVDGKALAVQPGSRLASAPRGLHADLEGGAAATSLHAEVALELAGTKSVAWAPIGELTTLRLTSDWPHPSFGGRFLPKDRDVSPQGFSARWLVSALATTAQQNALLGVPLCAPTEDGETGAPAAKSNCIETFSAAFVDPVNRYVLSDRAAKYGLLFVVLTFVGVGLIELGKRLRVHPVQYLLVGFALVVFFLLLLSLSEHVRFAVAYACASIACTALLIFYATTVLGGIRLGLAFGATIGLLYGALYALLQMEQMALLLGSLLLFAVLAAIMAATRRIDWYATAARLREDAASKGKAAGSVEEGADALQTASQG